MDPIIVIPTALVFAFLGGYVARRFSYPRVIGQLVLSLFIGIPIVQAFFGASARETVESLAQIGVIFLLFLTGFDIDTEKLRRVKKDSIVIAIFAALVPFVLGFCLGRLFQFSLMSSFVLGACMSVTAEGTKVALLLELKKVRTRIGTIMLGAGIFDDVFEILFLALVLTFSQTNTNGDMALLPLKIFAFIVLVFFGFRFLPKIVHSLERKHDRENLFGATILIALTLAISSELVGIGSILGAFIAGIIMQRSFLDQGDKRSEEEMFRFLSFAFFIPFFFFNIGLHFDLHGIFQHFGLTMLVLLTAILGKILGTLATKPLVDLHWRQLLLIGWGMNPRGVMELVIAQIAFQNVLISSELYSAIIFMAVMTTVIFPFVLRHMLKVTPNIME